MLPSIIALGLVVVFAVLITNARTSDPSLSRQRKRAATILIFMIVVQTVHFLEELRTGFHTAFGPVFGQPEMPLPVFVAFNVLCIVIFIAAVPGLISGSKFAFAAAWFLSIAGVLNGVAHPMLALATGGYFPGLFTSTLVFIVGLLLILRLKQASSPFSR
ncbi:MAG: HXXEE domain-containing protein [Rhodothermales bacterium]|nr:HXXEE domain-containing protein [Rhodothermales bacterium]